MPLTIEASQVGRFSRGYSWSLYVSPEGEARLSIRSIPPVEREFVIESEELARFRRALRREKFFELEEHYGQSVPCGSTCTLSITSGAESKTVETKFLGNWVQFDPSRLEEPARVLRVFRDLRRWFDDPEAVNLKRYDELAIEASEAFERALLRPETLRTGGRW